VSLLNRADKFCSSLGYCRDILSGKLYQAYRCAPGGWIRVELLRYIPTMQCVDANPLQGYSLADGDLLAGDEEVKVVTWKGEGDISRVGEMAAIRVEMFQAKLFAYRL